MKYLQTILLGALLALGISGTLIVTSNDRARAANALEFQAGRIIDDAVFTDWQSMNAGQIQEFLVAKNSVCLKDFRSLSLVDKNGDGTIQDSTTEQYGPETMSAAELIAAASRTYRINPKVILVTLQKEQGLITRQDCPAWRYNTALGYGCPDTAPCNEAAFGFTRQIDYGAYHFRGFFDDTLSSVPFGTGTYNIRYSPDVACGSSSVNIQNRATAALYSYTPYQPNQGALAAGYGEAPCGAYGNRNFFLYYTDWFGRPAGSSLVRTANDGTFYLLTNNKRYAIPSGDILYAYGLESTPVEIVGDSFMAGITLGGTLGTTFTIPGDGTVYLADGDKRYGIASGAECTRWGLNCGDPAAVKEIGDEIYFGMTNGGVLHSVAKFGNSTYLMEDGKKRIFLSPKAATERGYNLAEAIKLINWTNATRPVGFSFPENGSFVKFGSGSTIYAYSQFGFWNIPDYETFTNWYNSQTPSFYDTASQYNLQPPATSGSIDNIVTSSDGKKYLLDRGKRVDITDVASNWPSGISATPFSEFMARVPVANTVQSGQSSFRQSDGGIYIVETQTKRPFNSLRDYFDLGFGTLPAIQLSTNNLGVSAGTTVFAEGSGYKIAGGDTIYMIGKENKSYALTSVGQIYSFGMNLTIPTISPSNASQFVYQAVLPSLALNANGQYYIVSQKGKIAVNAGDVSRWGIGTGSAITLSNRSLDRIQTLSVSATFFASHNGTIYKGENGTKRPIGSFATYRALGGNDSNTSSIPDDILNGITTGTIYP